MGRTRTAGHRLLPYLLLLLAGCASVGPTDPGPQFRGASGPVAWEAVDIGQVVSTDTQRMRWSYTILLKETAGSAIQFERLEQSSYGGGPEAFGGVLTPQPFRRTLPANSEIRVPFVDTWGWASWSPQFGGAATLRPLTAERRFIGKDVQGRGITVIVRVQLDRGVGKLAKPVPATSPGLPPKALQPSDLETLAGTWRGSYRAHAGDSTFDVPLEITLRPDGSFEAGENDPVTNRFSGTFRVQEGRLAYSQRNDSGTLTLHEGDGRRIVFGQASGPGGAFTIRLEAAPDVSRVGSQAVKVAEPQLPPVDAPIWKIHYEWAYRWESPRGKGTFVWTVLREETVDGAPFYVIASGRRDLYFRKSDLAAYFEKVRGVIEVRHVPPRLRFIWPLSTGRQWEQSYTVEYPQERRTEDRITTARVEAMEEVTVPAGTFRAFKIVWRDKRTDNIVYEMWYSPEVKQWIRDREYLSYGVRTRELTSVVLD